MFFLSPTTTRQETRATTVMILLIPPKSPNHCRSTTHSLFSSRVCFSLSARHNHRSMSPSRTFHISHANQALSHLLVSHRRISFPFLGNLIFQNHLSWPFSLVPNKTFALIYQGQKQDLFMNTPDWLFYSFHSILQYFRSGSILYFPFATLLLLSLIYYSPAVADYGYTPLYCLLQISNFLSFPRP